MATKIQDETKEFSLTVNVKVNLDDLPEGVRPSKDDVAEMVRQAVAEYCSNWGDTVTQTGDADEVHGWVASTHPEVNVE